MEQVLKNIQNLRVPDRWNLKVLSGRGCPGQNEDPRTDDRPDPQRGERPRPQGFLEPVLRLF
jgi:hypothetical protein